MCGLDTATLAARPIRLSPVLTHGGQPDTSHPLCAGGSKILSFFRSVMGLDPQCAACRLTPDLQHTEADVTI